MEGGQTGSGSEPGEDTVSVGKQARTEPQGRGDRICWHFWGILHWSRKGGASMGPPNLPHTIATITVPLEINFVTKRCIRNCTVSIFGSDLSKLQLRCNCADLNLALLCTPCIQREMNLQLPSELHESTPRYVAFQVPR